MKVVELVDVSAWTPEIGGVFTDLRLKIKPYFMKERQAYIKSIALKVRKYKDEVRAAEELDRLAAEIRAAEELDRLAAEKCVSLVIGWENLLSEDDKPLEFTAENFDRWIMPLLLEKTDKPNKAKGENEFLTLSEYIFIFAGNVDNFRKN